MLDPEDVELTTMTSAPAAAPEAPRDPPPGAAETPGSRLVARTPSPAPADPPGPAATVEPVTRHPCSAPTRSGRVCGRTVATAATPEGWRCPGHRPRGEAPAAARPPVRSIRSADDAAKLASWAALEVVAGRMTNVNGNAIANLCREFRRAYEAGKHGAAYDAAAGVVDALSVVLAELAAQDPRVVQRVMPAGGPLDRAVRAYLAAARRAFARG